MNITVFLGANEGNDPLYREKAFSLGEWIGRNGHTLIYGGSRSGLMGVVADGALGEGAKVIGVEPQFFIDQVLQHEGITQLISVPDMAERKKKLTQLGDAFIAFPGGTGTLEEIAETISAGRLGHIDKVSICYNINHFYDPLKELFRRMIREGFLEEECSRHIYFAETLEEIGEILKQVEMA